MSPRSLSPENIASLQIVLKQLIAAQLQVTTMLAREGVTPSPEGLDTDSLAVQSTIPTSGTVSLNEAERMAANQEASLPINLDIQPAVYCWENTGMQSQPGHSAANSTSAHNDEDMLSSVSTEGGKDTKVEVATIASSPGESSDSLKTRKKRGAEDSVSKPQHARRKRRTITHASDHNAPPQQDIENLAPGMVSYVSVDDAANTLNVSIPHARSMFIHQEFAVAGKLAKVYARNPKCARCTASGQRCWVMCKEDSRLRGAVCGSCRRLAQSCRDIDTGAEPNVTVTNNENTTNAQ